VTSAPDQLTWVRHLAEAAVQKKAQDLVALDVHELTSFADAFLLATGTSDRGGERGDGEIRPGRGGL
jgi:ribosomal silencing factor RsfS